MAPRPASASGPRVALALGGGGARGLAHVWVLRALDEMGIRPVAIAGTSIGAVFGAAYASGIDAETLRAHASAVLRNRGEVLSKLMPARVGRFLDMFGGGFGNPVLLDPGKVVSAFLPQGVPDTFEELAVPFTAIATDFYARRECTLTQGPLRSGIAASTAIPGLFKPVVRDERVLVDGGAVNPLPFDVLRGQAEVILACDVTGGPSEGGTSVPGPADSMFSTLQIMMNAIVEEKLKAERPHVLVRPNVSIFRVLDFLKATAILRVSEPIKDEVKRGLDAALEEAVRRA